MRLKLFKSRSSRGKAPTISILFNLLKVFVPLLFIGFIAFWFLNYKSTTTGSLAVKTSVPGADILIGGIQTPFMSDTTIARIEVGRKIITVRKQGYVSEPEVQIVQIKQGELSSVSFKLKSANDAKKN